MNFGQVIEGLKEGNCYARSGWNGNGMCIYLEKGSSPYRETMINSVDGRLFELGDDGTSTRMPNINMLAADNSTVTGWLASQTDMLAEDWEEVV